MSDDFAPFVAEAEQSDLRVGFCMDTFKTDNTLFRVNQDQFDVWKLDQSYIFKYKEASWEHGVLAEMKVDNDYKSVTIVPGSGQEYLLRLAIESRLIREGCLSLHAACLIAPDGRTICMTGKSGVGKSTRVAAWAKAMDLEIISGDRPIIEVSPPMVYGAPWDGKEGLHKAVSAPLGCILNTIRSDRTEGAYDIDTYMSEYQESSVCVLSKAQAYRVLIAQTFLPMWDTDLAAIAMTNLKTLCNNITVMDLISGPDEASAISSWKALEKEYIHES